MDEDASVGERRRRRDERGCMQGAVGGDEPPLVQEPIRMQRPGREGHQDGGRIDLHSTTMATTATAKQVTALHRHFDLDGDRLSYTLAMAAVGQPLQHHLAAELHRTG